jgi:hypothetical protein
VVEVIAGMSSDCEGVDMLVNGKRLIISFANLAN